MPEGDTIFRAAIALRSALERQRIHHAESPLPQIDTTAMVQQEVASVETRGKHLLIHFANRRCLHTHMGMTGSWHVYEQNAPWKKPARNAHVQLATATHSAVCFTPRQVELLTPDGLRRHRWLSRLGPDILSPGFEPTEALTRLRVHDRTPIGEALMNQSLVSGIGNVYKSELLFLEQLSPFAPVGSFTDEQLTSLLQLAGQLMRRNTGRGFRQTRFRTDGPRVWVYHRAGELCLKCGERILMQRQGDMGRSTYYCPSCQR